MATITLPANVVAEKSVLGAILIDSNASEVALASLTETDFSNAEPRNRLVFRAMKNLYSSDRPIDPQTVINEIITLHLDNVVGVDYLYDLGNSMITPQNIDHYVQMVKDQAILRELLLKFGDIQDKYKKGVSDIGQFIADSNNAIATICEKRVVSDMRPISDVAAEVAGNLSKVTTDDRGLVGLDTGYKKLNELTHGWRNGDLIILAARPSVGKTTFGINLAYESARRTNKTVAFFSLEMTAEQVVEKLVARCAMVQGDSITTGRLNFKERQKISSAMQEISGTKIYFDDTPNARLGDVISKAHQLKNKHQDLGFIVIDYLGRIRFSDHPNISQRQQEISEISGALKTLARELDVPVLTICQLNRNVESTESKVPSMSNLRDSGSIEQDADVCMLMYRPDYYDLTGQKVGGGKGNKDKGGDQQQNNHQQENQGEKKGEKKDDKGISDVTIIVAKNRKGSIGKAHLVFQRPYSRFDDPSPEYEEKLAAMEAARNGYDDE